jgi:hypothetical protein
MADETAYKSDHNVGRSCGWIGADRHSLHSAREFRQSQTQACKHDHKTAKESTALHGLLLCLSDDLLRLEDAQNIAAVQMP